MGLKKRLVDHTQLVCPLRTSECVFHCQLCSSEVSQSALSLYVLERCGTTRAPPGRGEILRTRLQVYKGDLYILGSYWVRKRMHSGRVIGTE